MTVKGKINHYTQNSSKTKSDIQICKQSLNVITVSSLTREDSTSFNNYNSYDLISYRNQHSICTIH